MQTKAGIEPEAGGATALGVLLQCQRAVRTLGALQRQRETLLARVTDMSPHYSHNPHAADRLSDRIGRIVPELDALTRQIDAELLATTDLLRAGSAIVQSLPTATMQVLARGYWLCGMTLIDAARAVPICESHAWRLHRKIEERLSGVAQGS